ncbi:MAG: sodium ion-translocating decarboxylase subunit beta [Lachnospiraceae bacterium]|nr:sodium ion-translocating decarboxylase subunit beta [Lachnospiraceae bacterium]
MEFLWQGFLSVTWQQIVMYVVGAALIWLAIKKQYEPALLLPMGFGAILINLPFSNAVNQTIADKIPTNGIIEWLYNIGIEASEALPILLFIGIGAMIDFEPLLAKPIMFLFGAAAQFGIFAALFIAVLCGFELNDAASIGIIGAADGPTSLLVSQVLDSNYIGAIAVAAYSYMALVPIVQPMAIKLVTTKKERCMKMEYKPGSVSKRTKLLFPIVVTIIVGFIAPSSASLVGFLMFGNLIRECGVLQNLSEAAQGPLTNLITLLLGITISFSMGWEAFVRVDTLIVMGIGLAAFVFDTIAGVLFAKFLNLFMKKKINPMVGAAGISAFPMASRVVQKMAQEENPGNIIIMQAAGANVAGQISSAIAGGLIIQLVAQMM